MACIISNTMSMTIGNTRSANKSIELHISGIRYLSARNPRMTDLYYN
jgi:hypothetical protein